VASQGDRIGEAHALRSLTHITEDPAEALAWSERSVALAREAGALRGEIVGKQVWIDMLRRAGQRETARRVAIALTAQAARRAMRQMVALLELQVAAWAALESDWADAEAHRERAFAWGAATGADVERTALAAVDLLVHVGRGGEAAAIDDFEALEKLRARYDDIVRKLVARALELAPPGLSARLSR
jgi:hypothetical protein